MVQHADGVVIEREGEFIRLVFVTGTPMTKVVEIGDLRLTLDNAKLLIRTLITAHDAAAELLEEVEDPTQLN